MAFLADLIESFVPTLAFADNEEATTLVEAAPETTTEETTPTPAEDAPEPEAAAPVEEAAEPIVEEDAPTESSSEETTPEPAESSEEASPEPAEEPEAEAAEEEEEEDEDEDEDEDEEEGAGDPLDKLKAECAKQKNIVPYVHHYHECVERVTKEMEEEGYEDKAYKEDCVEEFFHLEHHLNDCVAPRLFHKLK